MANNHKKDITSKVNPPLSNTRLSNLIYLLVLLSALLTGYYSYRFAVKTKENFFGSSSPAPPQPPVYGSPKATGTSGGVEERINALAEALGMPSSDLAKAIAGAVREHVPPASLSSVRAKETGSAVEELFKEASAHSATGAPVNGGAAGLEGAGSKNVVEEVLDTVVGMDEP